MKKTLLAQNMIKKLSNKGQTVMEYVIVTGLIGIFCLSMMKQFGKVINTRIERMKETIATKID